MDVGPEGLGLDKLLGMIDCPQEFTTYEVTGVHPCIIFVVCIRFDYHNMMCLVVMSRYFRRERILLIELEKLEKLLDLLLSHSGLIRVEAVETRGNFLL